MNFIRLSTAVACLIASLAACSSVPRYQSGRKGFFDRGNPSERRSEALTRKGEDAGNGRWVWPLEQVDVTSDFGRRGRRFHEGVDLRARVGTPVYAVQDGEVIYAGGRIKGYGRMIVIRHDKGLFSVYAHHSKNLVSKGDRVRTGEQIALSGKSGRVRGPHLHFEIRKGVLALNPSAILPEVRVSAERALEAERRSRSAKVARADRTTAGRSSVDEDEDDEFGQSVQKLRKRKSTRSKPKSGTRARRRAES